MIAQRKFEIQDQKQFAEISGDQNPIHVDAIASRRLIFGEPVVHGMHLVVWALNELVKDCNMGRRSIQEMQVNFHKGILLDRYVNLSVEINSNHFVLRIYEEDDLMATINVRFAEWIDCKESILPLSPATLKSEWDRKGEIALMYDSSNFQKMFPCLSAAIPSFQTAILLTTTRLIGMECPGLNSLYSSAELNFTREVNGPSQMQYEVVEQDELNGVILQINGMGFTGKLRAYIRPAPVKQASMTELKALVTENEFQKQKAIIIGGSRGLGEITAKLLSLGGAQVTITYYKGSSDADRVQKEIEDFGFNCSVIPYNCEFPCRIEHSKAFTHLYYFATPRITTKKNGSFSESLFQKYCKYYVTGLFETMMNVKPEKVFYPSTISLSTSNYELPEYRAAKAASEELCRQMNNLKFKICVPRLSRLLTDQTNWFVNIQTEPVETIMLKYLREMEKL